MVWVEYVGEVAEYDWDWFCKIIYQHILIISGAIRRQYDV